MHNYHWEARSHNKNKRIKGHNGEILGGKEK